jgi:hypothetical protein
MYTTKHNKIYILEHHMYTTEHHKYIIEHHIYATGTSLNIA